MGPWLLHQGNGSRVLGPATEKRSLEGHHRDAQHSSSSQTHLFFSLAGPELGIEETLLSGCICL